MVNEYKGKERRFFVRFDHEKPVHYNKVDLQGDRNIISSFFKAMSKNISVAGILFIAKSENIPEIYSLIMLDIDYKIANICQEIENRVLIINNKLLGKVVRVENNEDGTCSIGAAFITRFDPLSKELMKRIRK